VVVAYNRGFNGALYVGGGAINANAAEEIKKLALTGNIPVTTTLMGIGSFPGEHPNSVGMLGMHGTAYANKAVLDCDYILNLGARFDDRVAKIGEFAENAVRAHIDIDTAEFNKRIDVDYVLHGDLKDALNAIIPHIKKVDRTDWLKHIQNLKEKHPLDFDNTTDNKIKPQDFIDRLYKKTNGKAEGPWKIAGGFEFRGQNQTLSTSGTSTTNILPRFNLALTGNFGRSGFLLDVDTDYQNINTNGLFKNITSNVLAVKGWGKLPLSDQGFLLLEGSAGPADYRISDSYQYGSAVRQKVVYRPGNAVRGELNISVFILSNQFEKRISVNSGVDRNLTTIGYAFDKDQKNIVSLGLDQYSGLAAQNQRLALNLGFALGNEVALSGRMMTESPAANQTETFYEMKLKFKALMTEVDLQVAQQSPGFSNSGPFEIAAVNVYQYEILPGTNEMGFLLKQKLGEILFARLGYSNGYSLSTILDI
jgi:hypothetical protein